MKKIVGLALAILFGNFTISQTTDVIMNAGTNGSTVNTCLGGLYDSGGIGANVNYQNNETYVITVCPDVPGDFITLLWTVFNLDCTDNIPGPGSDADNITVYDGPNTGSPTLGTYGCGALTPGDLFGATPANLSGCLTIEFNSNANGTGDFNAQLSCETPCDPPTAAGEIVGGPAPDSIAICVGDIVTFQDAGSTAGSSNLFVLEEWVWSWFDGSPNDTLTSGAPIAHQFNTPGWYVIQLQVIDDNGCNNLNATDIQVFVTTYPTFDPFPADTTICLGESLDFDAYPDQYAVEWSGFPLGVWVDDNCMMDLTGIVQTTPMTITGFDPNISLDAGNPDIFSICVDIEHSFLGDFVLQVMCPTGQIMTLHQQGGGGTNLGDPNQGAITDCNNLAQFGVPWSYCFTPTATETWVEAVMMGWPIPNLTGGNSLPPGDYEPIDPFSALDGCPINGTWQLLFTDLWGADDGSMPGWSINFDPVLDPPVTVFTPEIGVLSDSSWWDLASPGIISNSADGNSITVSPTASGVYDYTFYVLNGFGCNFDSTVQVTVTDNAPIDLGLDTALCNGGTLVIGPIGPQCSNDGGNFTYCYNNNENGTIWTFCPDNPGDGITFMDISFNSGSIETFWDDVWIYDGNNTGAPLIAGPIDGDLTGMNWTATNATGCITMQFFSDGSVSCTSGSTIPWDFDVGCGGGPQLVYNWTPDNGSLSDVNIMNPIASPLTTTTYTLSAYPVGHPDCVVTDDVIVMVGGTLDTGTDSTSLLCFEGPAVDLFNWLGGTPQILGQWYNPAGQGITMPIQPDTITNGLYEYRRDSAGCTSSTFIDVQVFQLTGATIVTDSDCQACNGEIQVSGANGTAPYTFSNDVGVAFQAGDTFTGLCGAATPGVNYSYVVQDSLGCQVTVDDNVMDINIPTLDPVVFNDAACFGVCDGNVTLSGANLTTYSIDNGTTNQANGSFTGLCPGVYDVLVDNGSGCTVLDQFTITEPPVLQIDLVTPSPDITICSGETVTATVTGSNGIGNIQFDWTSGITALGSGTPIDIVSTGTMNVCVTMTDDCPTTDIECFNILEPPPANPSMMSTGPNACAPDTVIFYNTTNALLLQTIWSFSDGTVIVANASDSIIVVFEEPGFYDVNMEITTVPGCVFDTTFNQYVEVYSLPDANFNYIPIPATIYDTEVTFTDYSSGDVTSWLWNFGTGMVPNSSNQQDPVVNYPEGVAGNYPMILYVWNDNECVDSAAATVQIINEVVIYAPNVFTPGGGDEFNETWRVYISGIDIYDFHLVMYNRWGEPVWESYNTLGEWNGRYGPGGFVQDGTYVWLIEAKDSYSDKKYEFRGHVTVLK